MNVSHNLFGGFLGCQFRPGLRRHTPIISESVSCQPRSACPIRLPRGEVQHAHHCPGTLIAGHPKVMLAIQRCLRAQPHMSMHICAYIFIDASDTLYKEKDVKTTKETKQHMNYFNIDMKPTYNQTITMIIG